ncbi:MAG: hypothetical protein RJA98_1748 [Pseudomonadota bacterium]|jgi:SEC-C motif-containing protein
MSTDPEPLLALNAPCPCGGGAFSSASSSATDGLTYGACCARWHSGAQHLQAPTAESLMRSRYSAFVLGLHDYLLATWHPRTRPATLGPDEPGLRWLGLHVKQHRPIDADHATVEFVARSKFGGRAQRMHEVSRFERDAQGHWLYIDGEVD